MEPRDFCYWLQGYLEISGAQYLSEKQLDEVKEHLALVMTNVTKKKEVKEEDDPWRIVATNRILSC